MRTPGRCTHMQHSTRARRKVERYFIPSHNVDDAHCVGGKGTREGCSRVWGKGRSKQERERPNQRIGSQGTGKNTHARKGDGTCTRRRHCVGSPRSRCWRAMIHAVGEPAERGRVFTLTSPFIVSRGVVQRGSPADDEKEAERDARARRVRQTGCTINTTQNKRKRPRRNLEYALTYRDGSRSHESNTLRSLQRATHTHRAPHSNVLEDDHA